jgi:hypothetical protein
LRVLEVSDRPKGNHQTRQHTCSRATIL